MLLSSLSLVPLAAEEDRMERGGGGRGQRRVLSRSGTGFAKFFIFTFCVKGLSESISGSAKYRRLLSLTHESKFWQL